MAKRILRIKASKRAQHLVRKHAISKHKQGARYGKEYDLYNMSTFRNIGAITEKEQDKLFESKVFVVGCGGLGEIAIDMLARAGVGEICFADGDVFEVTNLNRQLFSSYSVIGKKKVDVISKRLRDINSSIKLNPVAEFISSEESAARLFKGCDLVVDGLDNVLSRIYVSRAAKDCEIPYVFGAAEKTRGYSTVFLPKAQSYESVFMLPSNGKRMDFKMKERMKNAAGCQSILGVTANIVGVIQATQAINYLLGKKFISVPDFIHVSLFDEIPFKVTTL